jgi:hypothetical protein
MKKSWVDRFQGFLQSWIDIADRYRLEIGGMGTRDAVADQGKGWHEDTIGGEIESTFREFIKEEREQGNVRSDVSDEAIMTYIGFFQQGIASRPAVHDRMLRDERFSGEVLSLFIHGVAGGSARS